MIRFLGFMVSICRSPYASLNRVKMVSSFFSVFFFEFNRWYSRNDWIAWDTFIGHLLDFGMENIDLRRYVQIIKAIA
jgi:hypothetical protein